MEIKDLKIGTRLELELLNNNGDRIGNTYISQLVEPPESKDLVVSAPIYESRLIFVPMNTRIRITFYHSRYGLQGFTATVTSRGNRENISVLGVQVETPIEKIQRRKHYRLDCILNAEYRQHIEGNKSTKDQPPFKKALSKNLSGSGVCVIVNEEILKNSELEIYLQLDDTLEAHAICKVIRSTSLGSIKFPKYELGLHFTEITAQDQDNIIKFIFEKQRIRLKKEGLEK